MAGYDDVRQSWRRLRWRLRGALMWPLFGPAVLAGGLLLELLPIAGDRGPGLFPAILLAGFFDLAIVAALAPLTGAVLRRRRPVLPKVVATDRAGTALLVSGVALLVVLGLAHRPAQQEQERKFAEQAVQARRYVLSQGGPEYRVNLDRMDTWKQGPDLYRTCVPGPDPDRALCLLVSTAQSPPGIAVDPDQRPNSVVNGPDSPARRSG
jgi:hypothetical protein